MKKRMFLTERTGVVRLLVVLVSVVSMSLIGCSLTPLQTYTLANYHSVAAMKYTLYLYSSGQLKAVFLKSPEANVEVLAYSPEIIQASGTPEDVMAFMRRGIYRNIDVKSVEFKDKVIGYLFTYREIGVTAGPSYLVVDLFERNDKIFLDINIRNYGTGAGGGNLSSRMSR